MTKQTSSPTGLHNGSGYDMPTYTQIIYHIVFSTKNRSRTLASDNREALCRYIWGVIKEKNSHLYRIGGTDDHIHILSSLHPSEPLANFVRDIKTASSNWMKKRDVFRSFSSWQEGYGAFTHSLGEQDRLIEYIKNQELHHRTVSFGDELRGLLREAGIHFDEKYLL